jgi:Fur family ferric uptake transcriptional regulator
MFNVAKEIKHIISIVFLGKSMMHLNTKVSSAEIHYFETYLRSKKLKLTSERVKILATIFGKNTHFNAEGLHTELKQQGQSVSRATIYRTLDLLVQCDLVRKNSLGSTHANYEAVLEDKHHDHLICLNCNRIIEFYRLNLERLQEEICCEQKFKPLHHSLQIFGLCLDCVDKTDSSIIRHKVAQIHT